MPSAPVIKVRRNTAIRTVAEGVSGSRATAPLLPHVPVSRATAEPCPARRAAAAPAEPEQWLGLEERLHVERPGAKDGRGDFGALLLRLGACHSTQQLPAKRGQDGLALHLEMCLL